MEKIPLLVPDLPTAEELLPFLRRIDQARWYTNFGPLVRELEAQLGEFAGAQRRGILVSSCTLGLELALAALDLPPGARVLIPALTFVATASAVVRCGLRPVVADVDPDSWLLTPAIAEEALRQHVIDCVMPVATFGCPQDVAGWDALQERHAVPVVVDAAGALGNQTLGERCHLVFSLHATKSLGSGEGGYVASRDAVFLEKVRRLSNFGIDPTSGIVAVPGTNAKLSEYHAAVGLAALASWPRHTQLRRGLLREYADSLFRLCPEVRLQQRPDSGIYTILAAALPDAVHAERVSGLLGLAGIETRRWYYPLVHRHPGFRDALVAGGLDVAERLSGRILGLPFHVFLSRAQRERVCALLAEAIRDPLARAAVSRR